MKNRIFILALALLPLAAHADDISISCNSDKIVFGDDDVTAGENSTPSLGVNGRDVKGVKVLFREGGGSFVYIVTEPKASLYHQYIFTVSRGCETGDDDKGKLTVHQIGAGKESDSSYSCTCSID